jgi:hypothetical protein
MQLMLLFATLLAALTLSLALAAMILRGLLALMSTGRASAPGHRRLSHAKT